MKSIWNNTFYNTQPALGWTFDISFDEYYTGDNTESKLGLNRFAQAAVDITIGKRESEYTSVYYAGIEVKKFTRAQNTGTFTIKFNEDKFYTITGILENIYNTDNLNQSYFNAGTHTYNNPTIGNRKITVNMYDPNTLHYKSNEPVVRYEFYDCHIMSIDDINLSYESTESITRSVTFVYNYMQYYDLRSIRFNNERQAEIDANKALEEAQKRAAAKQNAEQKFNDMLGTGKTLVGDQSYAAAVASLEDDKRRSEGVMAQKASGQGYRGPSRGA